MARSRGRDRSARAARCSRSARHVFLALGVDVFVAMWIGGLVVGSIAAAITYPITLRTVETLRARRSKRRKKRRNLE
jgi:uncharacterized protein (DUF2062 family)